MGHACPITFPVFAVLTGAGCRAWSPLSPGMFTFQNGHSLSSQMTDLESSKLFRKMSFLAQM